MRKSSTCCLPRPCTTSSPACTPYRLSWRAALRRCSYKSVWESTNLTRACSACFIHAPPGSCSCRPGGRHVMGFLAARVREFVPAPLLRQQKRTEVEWEDAILSVRLRGLRRVVKRNGDNIAIRAAASSAAGQRDGWKARISRRSAAASPVRLHPVCGDGTFACETEACACDMRSSLCVGCVNVCVCVCAPRRARAREGTSRERIHESIDRC